jgi:hypothetical protein
MQLWCSTVHRAFLVSRRRRECLKHKQDRKAITVCSYKARITSAQIADETQVECNYRVCFIVIKMAALPCVVDGKLKPVFSKASTTRTSTKRPTLHQHKLTALQFVDGDDVLTQKSTSVLTVVIFCTLINCCL